MTVVEVGPQYAVVTDGVEGNMTYARSSFRNWKLIEQTISQGEWDAICLERAERRAAYDAACARHRQERQKRQERPRWGSVSLRDLGRAQTRGENISDVMS
jgi:hypothetical protein